MIHPYNVGIRNSQLYDTFQPSQSQQKNANPQCEKGLTAYFDL